MRAGRHRYNQLARMTFLVLGGLSIGWTASNPDRVAGLLDHCTATWSAGPTSDCPECLGSWEVSGCEQLARELGAGAIMTLLGALPLKYPEDG